MECRVIAVVSSSLADIESHARFNVSAQPLALDHVLSSMGRSGDDAARLKVERASRENSIQAAAKSVEGSPGRQVPEVDHSRDPPMGQQHIRRM
jgi:hypothetical protein